MKSKLLRKLLTKIRLRTYISIGIIVILAPLAFIAVYGVLGAIGGSDATPVAVWHLDEGADNTCSGGSNDACDSSGNGNDGAFGTSTAAPTWQTVDNCISDKCLYFDGSNDTITVSNTVSGVKSVSFWVKPITTTEQYLALNGSAYITTSSGAVTATGFTSPTYYINGQATTSPTVTANEWVHITVTTSTGISASAITIGNQSTNYGNEYMDEMKLFDSTLSANQVKAEYAGGAAVLGKFESVTDPLSTGLVGYWDMDDNDIDLHSCASGTGDVCDSSGNGNNAYDSGAMTDSDYVAGVYNTALDFDGSNDTVATTTNTNLNLTSSSVTIAAWIRTPESAPTWDGILLGWNNTAGGPSYYIVRRDLTSVFRMGIYDSGNSEHYVDTNTSISINTWYHIAMTYNYDTGEIIGYLNGSDDGSTTISANTSIRATNIVRFAYNVSYYNGQIDDARIYNRALSPTEIQALYNGTSSSYSATAHWKMDEMNSTTAYDDSGNDNNLTLNNSPTWTTAGKVNAALDFEANNSQSATISDNASLSLTSDLSLSAWIKPESTTASTDFYLAGKDSSYWLSQYEDEIRMYIGSSSNYETTNSANLQTGNWYHVLGIYDATAQTVAIYINGILQPSTTTGTIPSLIADGTGVFFIGGVSGGGGSGNVVNTATTSTGSDTNDLSITLPTSGVSEGDVMYMVISITSSGTIGDVLDTPSGWTRVTSQGLPSTTSTPYVYIFRRTVPVGGLSSPQTVTRTGNTTNIGYSAVSYALTGVATTEDAVGTWNTGTGSTHTAPAVTTTATNTLVMRFYVEDGNSQSSQPTLSAHDNIDWSEVTSQGNGTGVFVYSTEQTGAGSTGTAVLTATNDQWAAETISIEITSAGNTISYYDGVIDDVRLYPYALSSSQALVDYNIDSAINFSVGSDEKADIIDGAGDPPVVYYNLDENTGTSTVPDHSGRNNTATMNGSMTSSDWVPGKVGSGLDFDGSNDSLTIAAANDADVDFSGSEPFTMCAWIYPKSSMPTGSQGYAIFSKYDNTVAFEYSYILIVENDDSDSTGDLSFVLIDNSGYDNISASTNIDSIQLNTWYHVCGTYNGNTSGTANSVKIYLNGQFVSGNSSNLSFGGIPDINVDFTVGDFDPSDTTAPDLAFNGIIDEVKVYAYERTLAQVAYDYNRGAPVAWWKMDDNVSGNGQTIYDNSVNSNGDASGHNGTTSDGGATLDCTVDGKINLGCSFDGSDDVISISNNTSIDFNNALSQGMTISAWIKPDSDGEGNAGRIWDKGTNRYCRLGNESGGQADVICIINLSTEAEYTAGQKVTIGQWNHVAMSWTNDGDDEITICVNGICSTSSGVFSGDTAAESNTLYIGGNGTTTGNTAAFDGIIDDVRVYSYEMSTAQIKNVMNDGSIARFGP